MPRTAPSIADRRTRARAVEDPVTLRVQGHLWLVEAIVTSLSSNWPRHIERAELVSAGRLGLVEAARRFEPERGFDFATFARPRVRGALLDLLRGNDWAPRRLRSQARDVADAVAERTSQLGRQLSEGERADAAGITRGTLSKLEAETHRAGLLSLDAPSGDYDDDGGVTLAEALLSPAASALQRIEDRELLALMRDAIHLLDERQRDVIEGYFLQGRTSEELARKLKVTESRISQIRTEALTALNHVLKAQWAPRSQEPPADRRARRAASYAAAVANYRTFLERVSERESELPPSPALGLN